MIGGQSLSELRVNMNHLRQESFRHLDKRAPNSLDLIPFVRDQATARDPTSYERGHPPLETKGNRVIVIGG
jgi:hypothetical protein